MHTRKIFLRSIAILFVSLIYVSSTHAANISIMAYNVENMFDSYHDEGKQDWTYLPLSEKQKGSVAYSKCAAMGNYYYKKMCFNLDWTPEVSWQKVRNISHMVRSYRNFEGPDIVVFEEVEKVELLKDMVEYELYDLGYNPKSTALIEGPDGRGIDIGVISRFPLAGEPKLHVVDLSHLGERYPTRGIFEVPLKIGDRKVTVFGNHWPSPSHKPKTRITMAEALKSIYQKMPKDSLAIALGDFNTIEDEHPNGFDTHLLKPDERGYFFDVYSECVNARGPYCSPPDAPAGTYYYRSDRVWNRLDRLFISDSFMEDDALSFYWTTFVVYAPVYPEYGLEALDEKGFPLKFDPKTGRGFSDHLPIVWEFEMNPY